MIFLPRGFFDQESTECGKITLATCAVTEPGELVRIDDHVFDGVPTRLLLQELLTREVEPFIIGVGEVRMIRKHGFDGLVVVAAIVSDQALDHVASPTFEVTPAMQAAGIEVLDRNEGLPIALEALVSEVFSAMAQNHKPESHG